jgi:hypothetical protein
MFDLAQVDKLKGEACLLIMPRHIGGSSQKTTDEESRLSSAAGMIEAGMSQNSGQCRKGGRQ